MDFNPLANLCPEIQKQIDELQQDEQQVAEELLWYASIDPLVLSKDLSENEVFIKKLELEILALENDIRENVTLLREIESSIGTLTSKSTEIKGQINRLKQSEKQVDDELLWYASIDPIALEKDLSENEAYRKKLQSEILIFEKDSQENTVLLGEIESAIRTLFNPFNWFAKDQVNFRRKRTQLREIGNQKAAQRQFNMKELEATVSRIARDSSKLQRHSTFEFVSRQNDANQIRQTLTGKEEELAITTESIRRDRERFACQREIGNQKTAKRQSNAKELDDARTRIAKMTGDFQRHRAFDHARRQSDLSQIKQSIAAKRHELAIVADRKRRVDELLEPLIQEIETLESKKHRADSDLDAAQVFDRRLSAARNSYDRAMVHEQCERRFSVGSPRKIIGERQRETRQLERDIDKAKRRVQDIAARAVRKIDTIVIDGNNLCYEGDKFIGLSAIESLVPLLAGITSVIVVFDPAIRRMLNTDDSGIQRRLGSHAKVHVVASRGLADETVLDLASANEAIYVLSNDRFGDFNEKAVVRDGRIIRHEIVNGNIFVHDLQLRIAYLAEKQELRQ